MAKEESTAKLKLVHLVYGLVAAAVVVGIAIGGMGKQQDINTQTIKQKVNKDIFQMHAETQDKQFTAIQTTMKEGFEKIDKKLSIK